jgi:hypothetical protein
MVHAFGRVLPVVERVGMAPHQVAE